MTRRLAAVLAADVAGYSRLMHEDEEATHARFTAALREAVAPAVARHGGRMVKSTGDGFLAEFPSAVAAVQCGLEFQAAMAERMQHESREKSMLFRVGVDVGDVIAEEHDIFGDHVNLAARLQELAEPGGIVITDFVHDYVRGRLVCRFEDLGPRQLKNITRPVGALRVVADLALEGALRFSFFGAVSMRLGTRVIAVKSRKLRALLGYLALSESEYETRERLVGVLWSESSEEQARAVLRQLVRELRGLIGEHKALRIGTRELALERDAAEIDVWSVVHAVEAGNVHPLLLERQHLPDTLLSELEDLDPAFRAWLLAKRQTLRERLLRALETILNRANDDRRPAALAAEAILNLDPTHEEAARSLMHIRASGGDVAGALKVYKQLWDVLSDEYDMEPSAATQQLVSEIKLGRFELQVAETERPGRLEFADSQNLLIAQESQLLLSVQPAELHGVSSDRLHLVQGFRQILIASLVRFRELLVTEESAPSTSPRSGYELQLIAQQEAQAIHLTLMLKELAKGFYVWTDGFELNLARWFDSQRRVVQRIAMALNVNLSADRLRRFSGQPDIALGLYDRWLRCQTLVRTFNPREWGRLEQQFREIVAAAPNFGPAYCGLADLHNIKHVAHPGVFRTRERERASLELARRAVHLDPADMRAQRSLAWAHVMAGRYAQAETHIGVACELNPNDSWNTISAALLLAFCGHGEKAGQLAAAAMDLTLSPGRTHWAYRADIAFLSGDYASAIEAADRSEDVLWGVPAWRTAALAYLGMKEDARSEGRRFLARVRANWVGETEPTDEAIMQWLLHLYPIALRADWERLRDGLLQADLPVRDLEHGAW